MGLGERRVQVYGFDCISNQLYGGCKALMSWIEGQSGRVTHISMRWYAYRGPRVYLFFS
jgi:hypothetical protein